MRTNLGQTFHLECFACSICHYRLQTGDEYAMKDGHLLCKIHYDNCLIKSELEWTMSPKSDEESSTEETDGPKGPKRPRTILNANQRRRFKTAFEMNPKPCRKIREVLANETGLSPRVVQVWFQNQRAKVKKLAKRQSDGNTSPSDNSKRKMAVKRKKKDDLVEETAEILSDSASDYLPNSLDGSTFRSNSNFLQAASGLPNQANSFNNPINRLYSMQSDYFNNRD
ncbi:DgyrCDS3018 [Dimorphilus gyrociliatus]|nr:DgyrCDS3018 [Dimorphilus gyrociliatus]